MELVPYPLFSTHRLWARTLIVGFPLINFIVVRAPLHHCATFARFPGSPPHSCSRSITGGIPSVCGTPSTIAASPQGTHFDLVSSACTVRLLHRIRRAHTTDRNVDGSYPQRHEQIHTGLQGDLSVPPNLQLACICRPLRDARVHSDVVDPQVNDSFRLSAHGALRSCEQSSTLTVTNPRARTPSLCVDTICYRLSGALVPHDTSPSAFLYTPPSNTPPPSLDDLQQCAADPWSTRRRIWTRRRAGRCPSPSPKTVAQTYVSAGHSGM